jgi:twitching motility protein PilT
MAVDMKELFDLVQEEKASDLLLTAGAPPAIRVDGKFFRAKYDPLTPEDVKRLVYSILTDKHREIFEEKRELDLSLGVTRKHRFRVNVYMQKGCVAKSGGANIVPTARVDSRHGTHRSRQDHKPGRDDRPDQHEQGMSHHHC